MEDLLNVLKVKPAAEDGTLQLQVFQETLEHSTNGNGTHNNVNGSEASNARVPGLSIDFERVQFGYTEERPVCTLSSCFHDPQC